MSQKKNAIQQVAKGGGIILIGQTAAFFLAFIFQMIAARHFSKEVFGIFSLGIVLISTATIFIQIGLPQAIRRFIPFYTAKKNLSKVKGTIISGLSMFLITTTVVIIAGILLSQVISEKIFHADDLSSLVQIFIFCAPLSALLLVTQQISVGFKRPVHAVITDVVLNQVIRIIFLVIAVTIGVGAWGLSFLYFAGLLVSGVGCLIIIFLVSRKVLKKIKAEYNYIELLDFALPTFFGSTIGLIMGRVDSIMIGYFLSPTEVGVYRIAYTTAAFLGIFRVSFGSFFLPVLTEFIAKKKKKLLISTYRNVTRFIFLLSFPCALLFVIFSNEILIILFGSQYADGAFTLTLIALSNLIIGLFGPVMLTLQAFGKTRTLFKIQMGCVMFNLILNLILIPWLGINGAAISTALNIFFVSLLCYIMIRKWTKVKLDWGHYGKYILSSIIPVAVLYVVFRIIPARSLFVLLAGFLLFFIAYFAGLIFLKSFDKDDIMLIKSFEKKMKLKSKPISRIIKI